MTLKASKRHMFCIAVSVARSGFPVELCVSRYIAKDMPRQSLEEHQIHPAVRDQVAQHHQDIVQKVQEAIASHDCVGGHGAKPRSDQGAKSSDRGRHGPHLFGVWQLLQPMATSQCLEDVDGLAHFPYGVSQRCFAGWAQRHQGFAGARCLKVQLLVNQIDGHTKLVAHAPD